MSSNKDRFRLNPLTRYFSRKEEERAYREFRFKEDISLYRTAIRFALPAFAAAATFIAWKIGIHVVRPMAYVFWIIMISTLLGTALILKKKNLTVPQGTSLRVTVYTIGLLTTVGSLAVARPGRVLYLSGVIYCAIFIINAQNSSFVFKAILTSLMCGFYLWLGINRDLPVDANFASATIIMAVFCLLSLVHGYQVEVGNRREYIKDVQLEEERKKSEALLHNILPQQIASQLKDSSQEIHVEKFESVSILFADIVGFTGMSATMDPSELVRTLNHLFSRFDVAAGMFGAEKIKTIGDAYMAVAGLPGRCDDHAARIAGLALEIRSAVEKYSRLMDRDIKIKIGIATGPVVAGIIGLNKFQYDLWGEAVNRASRLESHGQAGQILICEETKNRLGSDYIVSDAGALNLKGIGLTKVWSLAGHADVMDLSA